MFRRQKTNETGLIVAGRFEQNVGRFQTEECRIETYDSRFGTRIGEENYQNDVAEVEGRTFDGLGENYEASRFFNFYYLINFLIS